MRNFFRTFLLLFLLLGFLGCELEKVDFITFRSILPLAEEPLEAGVSRFCQTEDGGFLAAGTSRDSFGFRVAVPERGLASSAVSFYPGTGHDIVPRVDSTPGYVFLGNEGNDSYLAFLNSGAAMETGPPVSFRSAVASLGLVRRVSLRTLAGYPGGYVLGGEVAQSLGGPRMLLLQTDSAGITRRFQTFDVFSTVFDVQIVNDIIYALISRNSRMVLSRYSLANLALINSQDMGASVVPFPSRLVLTENGVACILSRFDTPTELTLYQTDRELGNVREATITMADNATTGLRGNYLAALPTGQGFVIQAVARRGTDTDLHYLIRTSPDGSVLWRETFDLARDSAPAGIVFTRDRGLAALAITRTPADSLVYQFIKTDVAGKVRE